MAHCTKFDIKPADFVRMYIEIMTGLHRIILLNLPHNNSLQGQRMLRLQRQEPI